MWNTIRRVIASDPLAMLRKAKRAGAEQSEVIHEIPTTTKKLCGLAMTLIVTLTSCGGGSDKMTVNLTPAMPDSLLTMASQLELVASVRTSSDEDSEIVAGPATGELREDGSYEFNLKKIASIQNDSSYYWINFYYASIPPLKKGSEEGFNVLVAQLIKQFSSVENGTITPDPHDFDTTMDDDEDGVVNLVELTLGLDPTKSDTDGDGVPDGLDAFPSISTEWGDLDGDGVGDNSDDDIDGDGLLNEDELIYGTDPMLADSDGDGSDDGIDNCRAHQNENQKDTDGDGRGDACEDDADGDGLSDSQEAYYGTDPLDPDTDNDGLGDLTEINLGTNPRVSDTDGDGIIDRSDNCPKDSNSDQQDIDSDNRGDACDLDQDNDGIINIQDNCPEVLNENQYDDDLDGVGNACDVDADGDGIPNETDNCPYVSNPEQSTTDLDGDEVVSDCDLDDTDNNVGAKESGIFVDVAHGSDSNDGSILRPLASISNAITKAKALDKKIYVAAGTYDVSNVLWRSGVGIFGGFENSDNPLNRFSIRNVRSGNASYKTILTRDDADVTILTSNVSGLVIGGFFIGNSATSVDEIEGGKTVEVENSEVTLDRNTITGNQSVFRSAAISLSSGATINLTRNYINGGGKDGAGSVSKGILFEDSTGIVTNNIIRGGDARFATALELANSSPIIVNNTIEGSSGNAKIGSAEGLLLSSSSPVVANNLIIAHTSPDQYPLSCEGDSPDARALFQNNLLAVFPQGNGNPLARDCDGMVYSAADFQMGQAKVAGNVAYTQSDNLGDLINFNYRLVGGGGADGVDDGLDASSDSFGSVTKDYNNAARPRGASYDIGAIEN